MKRTGRVVSACVLATGLAACAPSPDLKSELPLIPRQVLFGNPEKAALRVSPDGEHLSFLAPLEGVLNVWVAPVDHPAAAKPVTRDEGRGIRIHFWAYTSQDIIYLQDKGGDENWQVHAVNLQTGEDRNLTPFEEIPGPDGKPVTLPNGKKMRPAARVQHVSPRFPTEILIGLNNRNPQSHDLYRVNIGTGKMKMVQRNDGFLGFTTDDDYQVRLAARLTPDGGNEVLEPKPRGGWQPFTRIPMEDLLTTSPVAFDKSGEVLYMIDSRGRDTAALTEIDLKKGETRVLAADPQTDVSDLMIHPTEKTVQAVATNYTRVKWTVLDESIQKDMDYLRSLSEGDAQVTSRSEDDRFWTVAYIEDDGPVRYYLYDRADRRAQFLFTNRTQLENLRLAKMHPVVIDSRDGLKLVSYLTLPPGTDTDHDGRPDQALPLVLDVHGGPWGRDSWGYNSFHQWLANRGYAVLSVNFRGSTGFGKGFINAANLEWAGKMHDDLIDGVNWAVAQGVADKNRVAIMGGSYGGYATLVGLTFTPDVFACGVDIVGPSNLRTLLETIPPYWKPLMDMWATRVGDPRTEEGRKFLESRSPLNHVAEITKPLLIGQGANDPRVKQTEADQIVKAMQEKKIPVTYVVYSDEGHGFARPENRLSFFAITDLFLAQQLGGRFQPIGDDFQNSSLKVVAGGEQIPGLIEALKE
ncbi:MAG: S9 family peptidase [Acidobacteriota bacterium]